MFSLEDLLGPQQGTEAVNEISKTVGADQSSVNSAIQMALPILLDGLARNAETPQGAESLNNALEQDHDGSILDGLGGLGGLIFGGGEHAAPPRQADAGGILEHILGGAQGNAAQEVSNRTGLGVGQVAQILMFLAPIVMGYLGKKKRKEDLGPGDLSEWLGGRRQEIEQTDQGGILENIFDRNRDGSSLDDIASIAIKYMTNRQ